MKIKLCVCILLSGILLGCGTVADKTFSKVTIDGPYKYKVDSVMKLMTLDEKIGQMNQYSSDVSATGVMTADNTKLQQIEEGKVGSMLNVVGALNTRKYQEAAMKSRLHIPLIFGLDVIHGMVTNYPIPLAEAASFDLDLMRRTAAGAAKEASSMGIHWTFAPMVDVSRDARWGRSMEGAGEDTWYGCQVAKARVSGFQGKSLYDKNTILACAKHFAAYGACIAGKDYNTVDMSRLELQNVYLPPFKAACDAGVATFMNAFNDFDGVPATANTYLQRTIQKGLWHFSGFTVSDWGSIGQMIAHGYAADMKDAGCKAISGGCDMDMESRAYLSYMKELIKEKKVKEKYVDDAVRRILLKKFELGLFDDPYRYCDEQNEKKTVLSGELRNLSREAGKKSIVLLKNTNHVLPLSNPTSIALVGPLCKSKDDMRGGWFGIGTIDGVVTINEGLKKKFPYAQVNYAEGYDINTNELKEDSALLAAKKSDVVIVCVGERIFQSGENRSKAHIDLPSTQQQLVKDLKSTGKKVIVLLCGGRPLIFNELTPSADAILMTWWLGTEAGNAIADVVSGDYNPSAKLPITFPFTVGQCPIYYNYKSTGHPAKDGAPYTTGYMDQTFQPAYPFGFGLSYTTFDISAPVTDKIQYKMNEPINCKVKITNTGNRIGKETVQLYIKDKVASITRPIKELKGFQQVQLNPGETKEVVLVLNSSDLGFFNGEGQYIVEPGNFDIMVGNSSQNLKGITINLRKE